MPDLFLSYSREDQAIARRFATRLQEAGFSVWWDQALHPGEAFDQVTEKALEEAKAVVVLWSRTSVQSRWVRAEATQASADNRLVPVMIEACKRPIMFELTHTADLMGWSGDAGDPRWLAFIESLRRHTGCSSATPADGEASRAGQSAQAPRRPSRRLIRMSIAAGAVVMAAALAWFLHSTSADADVRAGNVTMVVLPFDEVGPGSGVGLGAGMADAIRDSLDRVRGMAVTPRTSSLSIKPRAGNLQEVRRELGVAHMLEGTTSQDGGQLHVSVRLVELDSGRGLWSQDYNRPATDIFNLQKDIAAKVAQALQVKLGVGVGHQPGMTRNVAAYEAFLQAGAQGAVLTPDSQRRAMALMDRAVALDPDFALAWAALSSMASTMPLLLGMNVDPEEVRQLQRRSALAQQRYEALMQGTPDLETVAGLRQWHMGDLRSAARHFERASQLREQRDGTPASGGHGPPIFLLSVGHVQEAAEVLERQVARDPLNAELLSMLVAAYSNTGRHDAAIAKVEEALSASGTDILTATMVAMAAGDKARLRRWHSLLMDRNPDIPGRDFNTAIAGLLDRPAAALTYLGNYLERPDLSPLAIAIAMMYQAYFGDATAALEGCRKMGEDCLRGTDIWMPIFAELRALPGTRELMRRRGLVDYWREFGAGDFCKPIEPDWSEFECR